MGASLARRRKQPHKPEVPGVAVDTGPDTPAQRAGTRLEPRVHRGQQVRGKRRDHPLDALHRCGVISEEQRDAGFDLLNAWCETQRSPEKNGIYVDNAPDWDAIALTAAERSWRWSALIARVPAQCRMVVEHVVLEARPLHRLPRYLSSVRPRVVDVQMARRYREDLRAGLDALR